MVAYRYYLGPPRLVTDETGDYWAPPPGTVGWIDVAPLPGQGQSVDREARGCGFFAVDGDPLPSDEYDLLATGDLREIAMAGAIATTWEGCTGYRPPVAGTLLDALWEHLTDGSTPDGETGPLPLMPTTRGALDLHLGGHSLVRRERFHLVGPRAHRHAPRVLEALHRQYEAIERDEERGRARRGQALRVADYWRAKFRLGSREDERESAPWRVLLPGRARGRVRRLVQHETTITESFDQPDSTTLGPDQSWTELGGSWSTVSNACSASGSPDMARCESTLSSDDHYAQVIAASLTSPSAGAGPVARFSGSAATGYRVILQRASASQTRLQKIVAGSVTQLGDNPQTVAPPHTVKVQADGSSITGYLDGALVRQVTDTGISGHLRAGLVSYLVGTLDDFEAADLAVSGGDRTYPRGALRGILRGVA